MLKIHVALFIILAAASLTLAAPVLQESEDWELVAKLCGKLEHVDRIPDKLNPTKISENHRAIENAKLLAYERHGNIPCCGTATVTAETSSNKSGNFEFKGLPPGNYWFVAMVDQQQYTVPVVVKHTQDRQPVCSEMSFVIDDSGKFALRVRAPGR